MEDSKKFILTDYIRKKYFEDYISLSNWIAGILKEKEDFKQFIVEHDGYGRRDKIETQVSHL